MLSPYPLNQFRGSNLVATTHVIISNVASGSVHIWNVNSRDIVGFVDLSTGFNNTGKKIFSESILALAIITRSNDLRRRCS
jgi:hypothetical protein